MNMNVTSGGLQIRIAGMSIDEVINLVEKFEAENGALRRELLTSRQQAEDGLVIINQKNSQIQTLEDKHRIFRVENEVLKGEVVSGRYELEKKNAYIKDLEDQLYNLKTGNRVGLHKLIATNEIIQKQQCEIVNMLMTNGEPNSPGQSPSPSTPTPAPAIESEERAAAAAGKRKQQSNENQPSSSDGGKVFRNGYGNRVPRPSSVSVSQEIQKYDPAAPMMTCPGLLPTPRHPNYSHSHDLSRSLLNPSMFRDSNIIRSEPPVAASPNQRHQREIHRVYIKQEPKN